MGKWYMCALAGLLSAVAIHVPCSAQELAKTDGNFKLDLLHDAEHPDRLIEDVRTGDLALPPERSAAAQEAKEQ